ncbi:ADP-dependent glucokinase/phosphofructokinase [Muricomes intestini]|uniref:ADP-dependent glucokinase/phosphofructokinase n=1 Tax=Muricomes intestini TaxID=1796634 RepID=UPI002FE0788D
MAYRDKYLEYLLEVPGIIDRCRETDSRLVFAYTSNLDAIIKWEAGGFNKLLEQHLEEEPSFVEEETIDNMEDFARIVCYYAIHGYGGEVEITNGEVIEKLKDYFEIQYGLGGTCAQGAAALGAMGVPALIHITDQSEEVIKWMTYEGLESTKNEKRVPLRNCVSNEESLIHLVMQYPKGDILKVRGKEYEVVLSNRLIMDYDQVHKVMPVREEFLKYLEQNAESMFSYNISGFNAIVNVDVLKERLEQLERHYRILKTSNPDLKIYFESAHYISARIRDYLYSVLSGYIDVMGMNEEELVDLAKKKEYELDKNDIESVLSALDYLLELYPVKGIVMHSKDYALYYGAQMEEIDLEMGLTMGNLMSATRARIGHYGTQAECRETLGVNLSPAGLEFAEEISKMKPKHTAILVPSRYMEKPKYTIGLGDTFVAGMQMCFVK